MSCILRKMMKHSGPCGPPERWLSLTLIIVPDARYSSIRPTGAIDPWEVRWPGVWEMVASNGGRRSIEKWKQPWLSPMAAIFIDWLGAPVHK